MTSLFLLNWALQGLSLFNTILLLWLGLTVLLNAEKRTWGIWLTGGGLLLGAGFFICHSAILEYGLDSASPWANLWWQMGWIPIILLPLAWYQLTLWYSGFWDRQSGRCARWHRFLSILLSALGLALLSMLLFAHPLPTLAQLTHLEFSGTPTVAGVPLLFFLYPIYALLCMLLSAAVLRHPALSERILGNLAQGRTRPWLLGAAGLQFGAAVLASLFIFWALNNAQRLKGLFVPPDIMMTIAVFDLGIQLLIAAAVISLGQGIVTYEVFTGKTLPRRGFFRYWRSAVILAAGYGAVIGGSLVQHFASIYSLFLTVVLLVAFYALFCWRSFEEREQFMRMLRPFTGGQRLTARLAQSQADSSGKAPGIMEALCREVLNTRRARLCPLGAMAALAGTGLAYPAGSSIEEPLPVMPAITSTEQPIILLEPAAGGGYLYAVPLWAERGLSGVLLLGDKQDGGIYTQEEIEIARATGERLIDMHVGEEIGRRLAALQRQRLAETRVVDRRVRRELHDEVLPALHTAILEVNRLPRNQPEVEQALGQLTALHRRVAGLIHDLPAGAPARSEGGQLADLLQEAVRLEFAGEFEKVNWRISGHQPRLAPLYQEVLFYAAREAVRNAAVHGRGKEPQRSLHLDIEIDYDQGLRITVADDGVGYDPPPPRQAEDEELSSGSQTGLDLHATMLAILGGSLQIETRAGGGSLVVITLPM
jgi:signal transduction histidine kinase